MLTVITGLPGSGKTAGVVERFLMPLAAKDWQEQAITPDGEKITVKRRLLTNINGLLLEHEKIDADDLARWHEWAKPGDLIVFDEVQKPWPLTGANKEQPKCITELETHRHYGIDMILMTQHPMLINAAIVRLAGQHLHIRKLGNSRFATIYEWDGVSRTLLYKNAFAKKAWRRSKDAEKVYRSSSLHTKQKRAIPTVLFVIIACLVGFPALAWKFGGSFQERYFGGKPLIPVATPAQPGGKAPHEPVAASSAPEAPLPTPPASSPVREPAFAGCARIRDRCQCFDTAGFPVDKDKLFCEDATRVASGIGKALEIISDANPYREQLERQRWADDDREVFAAMARREDMKRAKER
ncbi:zonular occludens toxin domain-containing protein [Variovorax sp. LT1R16]|uniref:zonular occludens toxin domain-containing protein n=1 Tax=Variovorax sp. LT1R16 TaxID=3443728 RepID=UPI003F4471BD